MKKKVKQYLLKAVICMLNFIIFIMLVVGGSSYLDYAAKHDRFRLAGAIFYVLMGLIFWGVKKLICKKANLDAGRKSVLTQTPF